MTLPNIVIDNFMQGITLLSIPVTFAVALLFGRSSTTVRRIAMFLITYLFIVLGVQLFDAYFESAVMAAEARRIVDEHSIYLAGKLYSDTTRALIFFTALLYSGFNMLIVGLVFTVSHYFRSRNMDIRR